MKLNCKAPQRQLSQGCTTFIDSYCVICKNYARVCRNLQIMRSDAIFDQLHVNGIAPSHNIRGTVWNWIKKIIVMIFSSKPAKDIAKAHQIKLRLSSQQCIITVDRDWDLVHAQVMWFHDTVSPGYKTIKCHSQGPRSRGAGGARAPP